MTSSDSSPEPMPWTEEASGPAAPRLNSFQRLAGVVFAPAQTFADIVRKPDIVVPLLLIVLIGYASTLVIMPRFDFDSLLEQQHEAMRKQRPEMTDADLERMDRFTLAGAKVFALLSPIVMLLWYLFVAGVFLLAFRLFAGDGTFKQSLSVTLYSWIPLLLFSIIMTVVVLARGSFDPTSAATLVKSNPAFLVDMKTQPALFTFLASFDVFTIWTLALMTIGFSAMSRLSRSKSAVLVFALYFAMVVVRVGFAALGAMRAGS